ncbi:MAG: competence protein ComEC [Parcubacteria group bacterium Gr01-1014_29]|nr:MAG: competence protein ComEC [Parcubacteria group bacterium Gr01-1014_29]
MFFVWYAVFAESRDGLMVYFFDVGQGDSIFIQVENGTQILIDGGPDDAVLAELGRVMPFYDRTIDMVVLTHPDADHLNGLVEVLERYRVKTVLETGVKHETAQYAEWNKRLSERGIPIVHAVRGQVFRIDDGLMLSVLAPFSSQNEKEAKKINNTGVVARLDYYDTSLLFTADIEKDIEEILAAVFADSIDADVLKVAHHGSKTSSVADFLAAVTPEAAVISVGKSNRYGHPAPEVLNRFENIKARIFRTDIDGAVVLRADENGYAFIRQ